MLNKSYARDALQRAVSTGGDFAELFYEDTRSSRLSQTDDKIDTATTARIHGVGLRVYKGLRSVYVHSSNTDYSGLMKLADAAAGAIGSVKTEGICVDLVGSVVPNIHEIKQLPMDIAGEKRAALIRKVCKAIKSESNEIAHRKAAVDKEI